MRARPRNIGDSFAGARVLGSGVRLLAAPVVCGAWARSRRRPCEAPGRGAGDRCARHGGRSTGPKTAAGKARSLAALRAWHDAAGATARSEFARRAVGARWAKARAARAGERPS